MFRLNNIERKSSFDTVGRNAERVIDSWNNKHLFSKDKVPVSMRLYKKTRNTTWGTPTIFLLQKHDELHPVITEDPNIYK